MNASDLSRLLLQPRKNYVEVMQQQGRVVTDADWNEGAALDDEDRRRVLRDLIGPTGSPDDGFALDLAIGDAVIPQPVSYNGAAPVQVLGYRLRPGALYVEGQRFAHPADAGGLGGVVALQAEALQMGPDSAPLADPGDTHAQFLYLSAWEQWVSSIEDEEFREVALGGADTSTRVRRMARVTVTEATVGDDCAAAWATVRDGIEADTGGTFNAAGTELASSARLRVTFVPGASQDPCAPCSPDNLGRYLGADNQAVRIMMAAPDRYVFALDNAGPIHRVRPGPVANGLLPLEMLTEPRDEARWPLRNTVAEVMPWGALLDNGQKVADTPGAFLRVARGYDPDTNTIAFDAADAPALAALTRQWDASHPHRAHLPNDADPDGRYLYVRFWHRLDSAADPVLLDVAGPHTLLNRMGLSPTFSGTGIPGDHWIVTVRPDTPRTVVPWDLTQVGGVAPHGPRRLFAPLSLVTFRPPGPGEPNNAEIVESVADCRLRFTPLVDRDGCCTHSVGDGVTSFGDYASIQAAIDNLPAGGGRVCLLPGRYTEAVVIEGDGITLEGCGADSVIVTPAGDDVADGLVHVTGSRVTLRDLALETAGQVGVRVNAEDETGGIASDTIRLEGLTITADQRAAVGGQTRSGIDIRRARDVTVRACAVSMDGSLSDDSGVVLRGEEILMVGCRVESLPDTGGSAAWCGVQIGGGSQRVTLRRNTIVGGTGHGVTLGSLLWDAETTVSTSTTTFGAGTGLMNPQDPCAPVGVLVQPVAVAETRYDPRSAGDLADIHILDNRIEDMAANGISVLTLMPLEEDEGAGEMITTDRITIARNRIIGCVDQSTRLRDRSPTSKTKKLETGGHDLFGKFTVSEIKDAAIMLVEGEGITVRDNDIRDNGTGDPNPVAGISILYGDGILIEGNRIRNNGLRQSASIPVGDPTQAGIFVSLAGVASNHATQDQADPLGHSLRVLANAVDHPNGPALMARATGPVAVVGNHLLSQGSNATSQEPGQAACVAITNMGAPAEAADLQAGEPSSDRWLMPARTEEYLQRTADPAGAEPRLGQGGRVLFTRNHVTLRWVEPSEVGTNLGAGFSAAICSQDDVTCTANQFSMNVEDPGTKKSGDTVFARQPRMSAHVVVVGATASVSRNRIAEGVNDALLSHLTLGGLLASATDNVSTHLGFVSTVNTFTPNSSDPPSALPGQRVDRNNLVWLTPAEETSGGTLVSQATARATANELFNTFASHCLGLTVGSEQPFNIVGMLMQRPSDDG
ncbi:DUF6519 domain-containing protein [Roseospira navarrensis]|uniref:Right handed beta helix domain-containing protein n=1 Tax=Roseospira navarrensis TaxID=140058 RepID=A0A7X2D4A0_9PROT|nr:DUF6519 domain-containing protein [Roseospira navarrensis]MQX37641.1 hypothetical protein [Roseospira navarrensis]